MGEWKEYQIDEVSEVVGGGTPKTEVSEFWNGEIAWLTPRDLSGYERRFISRGQRNITEAGLENSSAKLLPVGTVLLSSRAPIGYLAIADSPVTTNQGFRSLIPNSKTTSEFLYYLLKNNVDYLVSQGEGTTFGELAGSTLKAMTFSFPQPDEQRTIASILSSLDDKIDLLHRQNQTLEALAESLFRQWFVEEADEGWEECSLFEAIEIVGGGTPKTEVAEYWNGNIKWISAKDITPNHKGFITNTEKKITATGLENSSAKRLPKFSTVISARGTVGKYCILGDEMTFSQSNYGIMPKFRECYFFTYLLIAESVEELKSAAYGTVFDTITTNTFKEHKINIPSELEIKGFEKSVRPYFQKMLTNSDQIRTLTQLRDTLLPKLMSGEVRVG